MKVLVAGSAGFIGSNLVEGCLKRGWDVIGVDNLATSHAGMENPDRIADLPGSYTFYKEDINNTQSLAQKMCGCDVVFLLAALPRVSYSIDFPLEAHHANATGILSVLEAARQSKVRRVVFSCSSSIFGGVASFPTQEIAQAVPKSPYALQKYLGAEYCRLYSELHGLDTVSLVYYNVTGKYQRTGPNSAYATVIPAFMDIAVNGGFCRIDGDGKQSRDFCAVENVVYANILAAEYKGNLGGGLLNVACGESYSVMDALGLIQDIFGPLKVKYAPRRLGDPYKSQADISKAEKVLGYRALVTFEESIQRTADWWKAGCPNRF